MTVAANTRELHIITRAYKKKMLVNVTHKCGCIIYEFMLNFIGRIFRHQMASKYLRNFLLFLLFLWIIMVVSVALLVARRTNNRKVVGSMPANIVCITLLTGNRLGITVRCGRPPLLLPSCKKLEFTLSALMDSDLTWVNGKSGR